MTTTALMPSGDSEEFPRRDELALSARVSGLNLDEIADKFGYATIDEVRLAIERALVRVTVDRNPEGVSHMRNLTAARLDTLLTGIWDRALNPRDMDQLNAQKAVLGIIDRQAALYGTNAPKETKVTHSVDAATITETLDRIFHTYAGVVEADVVYEIEEGVVVPDDSDVTPSAPVRFEPLPQSSAYVPNESPVVPVDPPATPTEP